MINWSSFYSLLNFFYLWQTLFRVHLFICSTFTVNNEFLLSYLPRVASCTIYQTLLASWYSRIQGSNPFILVVNSKAWLFIIPMKMTDNCIFWQYIDLTNVFAIGISEWKFTQCDPVRVRDGASNNLAMCQLLRLAAYQRGFTK